MQPASSLTHGVLPRYIDLAHLCREHVVEDFDRSFQEFLQALPDVLLELAEQAESNVFQTHCMDVRQELHNQRTEMAQCFSNELMAGFERFILGQESAIQTDEDAAGSPAQSRRLSLVEKETFEIELAFDTIGNSACVNFSELLFALNQRLGVINGGFKPGERSAALPGSPYHLCNAYRAALSVFPIQIDTGVKIRLIEAFDDRVLRLAEPVYQKYNRLLIEAGILPNLDEHPIYVPPGDASSIPTSDRKRVESEQAETEPEAMATVPKATLGEQIDDQPTTAEEVLEKEIFQNISHLLRQRRGAPSSLATSGRNRRITDLIDVIKTLRGESGSCSNAVPINIAEYPLEQIRTEFQAQLAQLAQLLEQHKLEHTDTDVIELVGMLFEQILNDPHLPDSVKALLSHLHTPYLKVALLDRKFFFKRRHPARRLLNALAQAGALCNATDKNEQTLYARMREIVNQVLIEFDDNLNLFEHLLIEFEAFLRQFKERARTLEKRAIEKAKGQERLREARQAVAKEMVQVVRGQTLPKAVEKLLFGPWANLLVLLHLRKGKDSEIYRYYLEVTGEIIQSVQPKITLERRGELRQRLPALKQSIREGLALLGEPESNIDRLLAELAACQQVVLASDPENWELPDLKESIDLDHYPLLQDIDPTELLGEQQPTPPSSEELKNLLDHLQRIKLGTWFEFEDAETGPVRAKLSWYSPKTSYYIFVNQAGIQTKVMPLQKLARAILEGKAKPLELDRRPFVERALKRIYALLGGHV